METAIATTSLEIYVECPYCKLYNDVLDDVRESLNYGELSVQDIDIEVVCQGCGKEFIITEVTY